MPIEKLRPSFTFTEDRLQELRAIVPEAFADGKIAWDVLREALGDHLEDETQEHFGLSWPGKRAARRLAMLPSKGTLVPQPGEGVNEENTRNIFIEGDNLEVLKLLLKSYAGRVKLIYIDPPYNTGNDFVYPDDYSEPLNTYLQHTRQMDEEGQLLTTNTVVSGRFHSNWLSMMYPRLLLARLFLSNDGVIFISINDHELHHLLSVMNELFGEENFLGTLVWQSKKGGGSDKSGVVNDHEYVVSYAKFKGDDALSRALVEAEELDKVDEKGPYRIGRELNKWGSNSRREDRPTMYFPVPGPNGEQVFPIRNDGTEGCWRWGKKKMHDIVERGDVEYTRRPDGSYVVYEKIRSTDPRMKPYRTWLVDVGTTADGSKTVKELFGGLNVADFPKPLALMEHLVSLGTTSENDVVMDFFAGYSTTAHATLEYNRKYSTSHSFICVQLPEPTPKKSEAFKAGFHTISELSQERIRRVAAQMQVEDIGRLDMHPDEDLGFKCYRLGRSHFRSWQAYAGTELDELETLFTASESPLMEGWDPQALLVEVMLLEGFPLDSRVRQLPKPTNNTAWLVTSDACAHNLTVCLDKNMSVDAVVDLDLRAEDVFICLDCALSDEVKMQLTDQCNLKVI